MIQQSSVPDGWREVKLGDVAQLVKNLWQVGDEKLPYIGLEHIDEGKLRLNSVGNSDSVASNKYRFTAGDTLFGKLRPYFRKVIKPKFEGICSTDIWVIHPKKKVNKDYLFYFFANQELVDISSSSSMGTRMPRAAWDFLSETTWKLPPLPEQKAIAEVLSSLDDKIDLLHRQNTTLENMAQTLFRKWFVEDADEGWEEAELGDWEAAKIIPSGVNQFSGTKKYFATADVSDIDFMREGVDVKFLNKPSRANMETENYSIWFARMSGERKVIWFVEKDDTIILSTGFAGIKATKKSFPYILFFILNDKFVKQKNLSGETKSVQPSVNNTDIRNFRIAAPHEQILEEFGKITYPLIRKITHNQKQSKSLENLRDLLLPKLMSGKVRVRSFT